MDKRTKNILTSIFWVVVAGVLVYFCLRSIDWKQFGEALGVCRWEFIILSMVLGVIALYVRGVRWKMLILPFDASTSALTCFNAYNIGMVANLALPRAGEVLKLGYIVKHSARDADGKHLVTLDKSLGTVIVERLWDGIVLLALGAALIVLERDRLGAFLTQNFTGLGSASLWIILGAAAVVLAGFVLLSYLFRYKGGIWGKTWGFIAGIGDGITSFKNMQKPGLFLLYTAVIWGIYWLMSLSVVWALQDIEAFTCLTALDAFFIMVVGSLSSIIPVPGGFGTYHGAVAGILAGIWGIPVGTGMIFATLNHESQVVTQALCGLASYVHESFIRK